MRSVAEKTLLAGDESLEPGGHVAVRAVEADEFIAPRRVRRRLESALRNCFRALCQQSEYRGDPDTSMNFTSRMIACHGSANARSTPAGPVCAAATA